MSDKIKLSDLLNLSPHKPSAMTSDELASFVNSVNQELRSRGWLTETPPDDVDRQFKVSTPRKPADY